MHPKHPGCASNNQNHFSFNPSILIMNIVWMALNWSPVGTNLYEYLCSIFADLLCPTVGKKIISRRHVAVYHNNLLPCAQVTLQNLLGKNTPIVIKPALLLKI